jgi:DNA polymerase-3 subunit delta
MMSERRVVRVTDVRVSSTSARDSLKEEYLDLLNAYLEKPSPHCILVFIADEINGNRKVSKSLEKCASVVEFAELSGDSLVDWISKEFDRQGTSVDRRTAQYLAAVCGAGLRRLSNEISKLAAAALPAGRVTPDLIDDLVSNTSEIDNFALTDHLVAGRGKQAVSVTKKILDDGGEPLMLLGLMSYNYRRLLMVKDMMDDGSDRAAMIRDLRLRYQEQEKYMAAARRTSRKRLMSAISQLAATDLAIKTSVGGNTGGGRLQLEMLICDLLATVGKG